MPLQPLAQNPPPLISVFLQGQGGPLRLPSVAHAHDSVLPALSIWQGVLPILTSNVPAPLDHISSFPLQPGGPCLQPSPVNPPPQISALIFQLDVLHLHHSVVRASDDPDPPPLSVLLQGQGRPPHPPSDVRTDASLLPVLFPQQVESTVQPSAVVPPPLLQLLALPLQQDVPPIHPLYVRSPPPLLSVFLQG